MVKNLFITGVHTGLGHALAKQFLDDGAQVFAISRTAPQDLADHPAFKFASLDLRRFGDIQPVLDPLLAEIEQLHVAILNAGVLGEIKDLKETSLDELQSVIDVNVWANKIIIDSLMALSIPVLQVVAISSGAAFNGSGGWGAYSISKSALNLLVRVFANEQPDTHFTALAPGVIETNMIHSVLSHPSADGYAANVRIKQALEELRILSPQTAAANVIQRLAELLDHPSGAFVDIRNL